MGSAGKISGVLRGGASGANRCNVLAHCGGGGWGAKTFDHSSLTLKRPIYQILASGRYWVVSECCLDIMEGVWKEYQMCVESTCKVSGSCKKDFLSQKLTNVKKKGLFWAKKPSWG